MAYTVTYYYSIPGLAIVHLSFYKVFKYICIITAEIPPFTFALDLFTDKNIGKRFEIRDVIIRFLQVIFK